jgi:hypothetical protein
MGNEKIERNVVYRRENVNGNRKRKINTDKINGIITLIIILANILYAYYWSVSIVLNIIIFMWVLVMIPTVLTYFRGRGDEAWKSV